MMGLFLIVLAVICVAVSAANPLGPYKVSDVTVSGLSSGGYMAVQVHMAYSSVVNGSAIFAGGPYYCAQNNFFIAQFKCAKTVHGVPDVETLISFTESQAQSGLIDSLTNLADDNIFLFSGTEDSIVHPAVMQSLLTYYSRFVPSNQIVSDFDFTAQHCFPTLDFGEACTRLHTPFIGKCDYDGAAKAFQTLYGDNLRAKGEMVQSNLHVVDQSAYFPTPSGHSLANTGYIYVPTNCAEGTVTCRLHVAFHGCEQTEEDIGSDYVVHTGLNDWAETNDIIVLYPFTAKSNRDPANRLGCWDWWGYTNEHYADNKGVQMQFVRSLIAAVTGR